jgi:hypothetical protein
MSHIGGMSAPLVVSIPHRLGQAEAVSRIKAGLGAVRTHFASLFTIDDLGWTDNTVHLRASALGQVANGTIDVHDDHVVVTVELPWLLAKFAEAARGVIRDQGTKMLEKK